MSATASLIMFAVGCLTIMAAYGAGWAARASQEHCAIEDAKELSKRAAKVLSRVEPTDQPPFGAVRWFGKPVKGGKVLETVEPLNL